jgi:coatomer subunit beta
MSSSESPCYSVVFEDNTEYPAIQDIRAALERGTEELKIETLRRIIVSTINGNPQVSSIRR